MIRLLGIDPGQTGALALIDHEGTIIAVCDMPVLPLSGKEEIDIVGLVSLLHELEFAGERERIGHAFIERAQSMPQQGVASTCVTCENYGVVRAVLVTLGIPVTEVRARVWKEALAVPAEKDGARKRATELLPDAAQWWPLAKHHNRAESAMIALFGLRSLNKILEDLP